MSRYACLSSSVNSLLNVDTAESCQYNNNNEVMTKTLSRANIMLNELDSLYY